MDNSAENLHVDDEQPNVQPVLVFETDINNADTDVYRKTNTSEQFFWGEKKGSDFTNPLNEVYERIVFWRKNLFLLPSGSSGKRFIRETTRLINSWIDATPVKEIAFKAIMMMPALLLQKPSRTSKSKDNTAALLRRLDLWERGHLFQLLHEGETIQAQLKSVNSKRSIAEISKQFVERMSKGNINGSMRCQK